MNEIDRANVERDVRQRVKWGLLAVCVLLVGGILLIVFVRQRPEPLYEGRTIREWVFALDPHVNARTEHDQAQAKLGRIGVPVVPELESILEERPKSVFIERLKGYAIRFGMLKPEKISWHERQQRACRAAYVIAEWDTDIRHLVPHLEFNLTNGTYADSDAARALARAGNDGIVVLTNLLSAGTPNVRHQSGWALHFVAGEPVAIEALLRTIDTETNRQLRANAVGYLRHSKAPSDRMVQLVSVSSEAKMAMTDGMVLIYWHSTSRLTARRAKLWKQRSTIQIDASVQRQPTRCAHASDQRSRSVAYLFFRKFFVRFEPSAGL